jgi:hypothetical protein
MRELKFVLLKDGTLHIGSAGSYHQHISNNAPKSAVKAAGYMHPANDEGDEFGFHSYSMGYNISFTEDDVVQMKQILVANNAEFFPLYRSRGTVSYKM